MAARESMMVARGSSAISMLGDGIEAKRRPATN
jgi:hypothetical protein